MRDQPAYNGDTPAMVIASSPLVEEGLASLLNGTRFHVMTTAVFSGEAGDLADRKPLPALILAAPDDALSIETTRGLRAAYPEAKLVIFGQAAAPGSLPKDLCLAAQALLD